MAYKNIDNIIINTSCNLFIEKGYRNVSVNEICSACSITKPTLYYHFKSKEDILYEYFRTLVINSVSMISELKNHDISSDNLSETDSSGTDTNTNKTNENKAHSLRYDGRTLVIEAFNILFSVLTSKGYDITQAFVSSCICDISKAVSFPDGISDKITEYIILGQKDGSIINLSNPNELYFSFCNTFVGYLVYWCQSNGHIDENNTIKTALLPLFFWQWNKIKEPLFTDFTSYNKGSFILNTPVNFKFFIIGCQQLIYFLWPSNIIPSFIFSFHFVSTHKLFLLFSITPVNLYYIIM